MKENSKDENLFELKEAIARIPHTCVRCGKRIEPGDIYYGEHAEKIAELKEKSPKCYCQECYIKPVPTTSKKSQEFKKILERIKSNMDVEYYTNEFYSHLAEKVTDAHEKKLFRFLAEEGKRHALLLSGILDTLAKEAGFSHEDLPSKPIDKKYSRNLSIVEDSPRTSAVNIRQALMDHIELEKNFELEYMEIALNIELSDEVRNRRLIREIKSELMKLAKDERRHHEQLKALMKIAEQLL